MLIEYRYKHKGVVMRSFRRLLIGIILLLFSGMAVSSVGATSASPTYNSGSFGCSSVRFSYFAYYAAANFRVVDSSNKVVSNTVLGEYYGTYTITLKLDPAQQTGTILQIQQDYGGWTNFGPATACSGTADDSLPPPLPWEHFWRRKCLCRFPFSIGRGG